MSRSIEPKWSIAWDNPRAVSDAKRAVEAGKAKGMFSPHDYAVAMARIRAAERANAERN
jgi:hypothetical protein